jgi:hypothetical protein
MDITNPTDVDQEIGGTDPIGDDQGVPPTKLTEDDLLRELRHLHETRNDTFLHAPTSALQHHSERTAELELEYLRRHPERDIDLNRTAGHRTMD